MIGRMWKGITSTDNAGPYAEYLKTNHVPEVDEIEGSRGAYVFRRNFEDGVEFVTLTLFESLDAVKAFAGDDYERAVVPPAEQALLTRFDPTCTHYEVVILPG
jgi:heme-degrading monooxygenase HmoA